MLGIGFSEMIVIAVILVIAVGPNKMPQLLKTVVKGYREFRRTTRELRASTGIDELLQDEDLRSLRKPLYVPPIAAAKQLAANKPVAPKRHVLTWEERTRENPAEGVDVAHAVELASRPSEEEAERIRQEKLAFVAQQDAIRAAKIAAAAPEDPDAARVRSEKVAAAGSEEE